MHSLIFLLIALSVNAQTINDAVRLSTLFPGGSSRVMGAGGSFGAMGGDIGSLTINPAGLAEFRKSEIAFTFSFNGGSTSSVLNGVNTLDTDHTSEPNLENIGLVFHTNPNGSLVSSNFGISFQQYNNFRQNFAFQGTSNGSIIERFTELANTRTPDELDDFEAGIAYEAGAIYDFDGDLQYGADIFLEDEVTKNQDISRSGKTNEFAVSWGAKFSNNLNIGLGVAVPFYSFEETKIYGETDFQDQIPFFNDLTFSESLSTSGTGLNFKAGIGYTLMKYLRLGLSFQSPTWMKLDDNFNNSIEYAFTDNGQVQRFDSSSPDGRFDYRFTSPMRLTGSIGALINTENLKGFINLDANYIDYSANSFNLTYALDTPDERAFERELNDQISNELNAVLNFNLGGELAYKKARVRAGVGVFNSALVRDSDTNLLYSLGVGFRGNKMYLDAAYQIRDFSESYIPYRVLDSSREQNVLNNTNSSKFSLTLGFKI